MNNKLGRNDPCHCGSGKKYKKCCFAKDTGPRKINAKVLSSGSGLFSRLTGQTAEVKNPEGVMKKIKEKVSGEKKKTEES